MTEGPDQLLEDKSVVPLELFFDLVFVLGITQTVALIVSGHDGQALLRAALILAILWWGWTQFTWTANSIDLDSDRTRVAFFVAMGAAIVMAVAVPTAFADGGIWLAGGYLVLRGIGLWLQLTETDDVETRASAQVYAKASWVGPIVFVIGALFESPGRTWIWVAAFALEIVAAGIAGGAAWHLRAGHFAERHGLIYIIALGEGIVAVGLVAAGRGQLDAVVAVTMLLAIFGAAALWWAYFDRFSGWVEEALRSAGDGQGVLARDAYSIGHYPMIVGVVMFAAAAEEVVAHPGDPMGEFTRLLIAISVGLALLSQAAVSQRARGPVLIERVVAVFLIALLMLPAIEVRANLMLFVVVAIVIGALVLERRRPAIAGWA